MCFGEGREVAQLSGRLRSRRKNCGAEYETVRRGEHAGWCRKTPKALMAVTRCLHQSTEVCAR
jgi:hypothetical protein